MSEVVNTVPPTDEELRKAIAQKEAAFQQAINNSSGNLGGGYGAAYQAQHIKSELDALKAQLAQSTWSKGVVSQALGVANAIPKVQAQVAKATPTQAQGQTSSSNTVQSSSTPVPAQPSGIIQQPLNPMVEMVVSKPETQGYSEPLAYYNDRTAYGNGAMPTFQQSGLPMNFSTNKFHNNGSDPQLSSWSGLNKSGDQLDPVARMFYDDYIRKSKTSNTQMLGATINNDIATALNTPEVAKYVQLGMQQGQSLQEALSGAMAMYNIKSGNHGAFNTLLPQYVPAAQQRLNMLTQFGLNSGADMGGSPLQGLFGTKAAVGYSATGDGNITMNLADGSSVTMPQAYGASATQYLTQQQANANAASAASASGASGSSANSVQAKLALAAQKHQQAIELLERKRQLGVATDADKKALAWNYEQLRIALQGETRVKTQNEVADHKQELKDKASAPPPSNGL